MTINSFDYAEEIKHEGFTQNYTKVVATKEKDFNAYHNYAVADVKTGKVIECIHFQEGPIKEKGINGVANEDVILMVVDRLNGFQNSDYACYENAQALYHLNEAIKWLRARTNNRAERGVEGTSAV